MYQRYTSRGSLIRRLASEEAANCGHGAVDTVHILLALLREQGGVAGHVLRDYGKLDAGQIIAVHDEVRNVPDVSRAALEARCLAEAKFMDHTYVGTEHLLLAICGDWRCRAARLLGGLGFDPLQLCKFVFEVLERGDEWERWRQEHPDAC